MMPEEVHLPAMHELCFAVGVEVAASEFAAGSREDFDCFVLCLGLIHLAPSFSG